MDFPKSNPAARLLNGRFTDGDPATGLPASRDLAQWGNLVTDEIMNVVTAGGLTPNEAVNTQLRDAIINMIVSHLPVVPLIKNDRVWAENVIFSSPVTTEGLPVYYNTASNRYGVAFAGTEPNNRPVGIAHIAAKEVTYFGKTGPIAGANFTPGTRYYLSLASTGGLVTTPGPDVVEIGVAISANELYVDIDHLSTSTSVSVQSNGLPSLQTILGLQNRIINGLMEFDQRYCGNSVNVTNNAVPILDCFGVRSSGGGTLQCQRVASAPNGYRFSVQISVAGIDTSLAPGDGYLLGQAIEGVNVIDLGWGTAAAQQITLAFIDYRSIAGTYAVAVRNSSGTLTYVATYTILAANTYQWVSITIPGPTTGVWANDTSTGVEVVWSFGCGSNSLAPAANSWQSGKFLSVAGAINMISNAGAVARITDARYVPGDSAANCHRRVYTLERILCQRYYEKSYNWDTAPGTSTYIGAVAHRGEGYSVSLINGGAKFAVEKRVPPATVFFHPLNGSAGYVQTDPGSANGAVQITGFGIQQDARALEWLVSSGTIPESSGYIYHYTADASLPVP